MYVCTVRHSAASYGVSVAEFLRVALGAMFAASREAPDEVLCDLWAVPDIVEEELREREAG